MMFVASFTDNHISGVMVSVLVSSVLDHLQ